jgi:hypothetical protein
MHCWKNVVTNPSDFIYKYIYFLELDIFVPSNKDFFLNTIRNLTDLLDKKNKIPFPNELTNLCYVISK